MAGISARYWRINVSGNNGAAQTSIAEVRLQYLGADLTTSGKSYLGTAPTGGTLAQAFDGSDSGGYPYWTSSTLTIGVDMGGAVTVDSVGLVLSSSASVSEAPQNFTIEYSGDGSAWAVAATPSPQTSWVGGVRRNYDTVTADPYLSNVVLLLPFTGTSGSTTLVDESSASPKTVTSQGGTAVSNVQKKFGLTSGRFNDPGTFDKYATVTPASAFDLGSSDFTVEAWVYPTETPDGNSNAIFCTTSNAGDTDPALAFYHTSGGTLVAVYRTLAGVTGFAVSTDTLPLNTWGHVAVARSGSSVRIFVNGALQSGVGSVSGELKTSDGPLIGRMPWVPAGSWTGYMDDFRVTIGVARYVSTFTVPTAAFETYAPPSFVAEVLQGAITLTGQTPVFESYVPLAPIQGAISVAGQTASVNTGFSVPQLAVSVIGQQPLLPVYALPSQGTISLTGQQPSVAQTVIVAPTQLAVAITGQVPTVVTSIPTGDAYYGDVVLLLPLDGSNGATTFTDYSRYSRTLTPSGNAQISTAQSKFGGAAALFDGTADYLSTPDASELHVASSDFTIELWVYRASATSANMLLQKGIATGDSEYTLFIDINGYVNFGIGVASDQSYFYNTTTAVPLATWKHLAVTKAGSQIYIFIDGVSLSLNAGGVLSTPTASTAHPLYIGRDANNPDRDWDGYIDDLRITAGVARYTATFTLPTEANPTDPQPGLSFPSPATLSLSGQTPLFNPVEEGTADLIGRGFQTLPTILGDYDVSVVTGGTFSTVSKIYGGSLVVGSSVKSVPTVSVLADQTGYVTGRGFSSIPTIEIAHGFVSSVHGRGFSSKATVVGGSIVAGRAFSSPLTATIDAPISLSVTGQSFQSNPTIVADYHPAMRVTGRGFVSGIGYSTVTGRGFTQDPILKALETVNFAEAFVFNLVPANREQDLYSVSRYQNYPFQHLTRIANEYYGVKSDGLYRLTGEYDTTEDVLVNGTIKLNEDDLSAFNSQNIPYIYLNGDDDYTATAFVDDVEQPAFSSGFNGRRVKLARGSKGRYWYFKIEGIKSLLGVEYRPEKLARKVK